MSASGFGPGGPYPLADLDRGGKSTVTPAAGFTAVPKKLYLRFCLTKIVD